ncbi:solute carrier family 16 member 6b [Sinocyclocheilus grahami]|uniref:Monocarboxylate transporter 7 n=1 Tax=Sinocyclocheilus grahami TaxID=75366 RepID=A0A672SS18_SINGR|nr:PREDICTED: monocarboxylate transporter 7-like [Sinocyclocheilus grahami]
MTGIMSALKGCTSPNVYDEVPDGGWGWMVAAAFFFVEVFTYGIIKIFGIFLQDLMTDFNETNSRVSWVVSICVFVMAFTAPLSTVMSNRFGYQPVVMVGGLLISLGTITTAFTNSIIEMYITMGIVAGLGYCLTFLPTVTILTQYFSKRRSLVTSIASTGECFSLLALAPAMNALKEHMGWRNCLIMIGVMQALIIVCGALLKPIVIKPKPTASEGSTSPLTEPESKYDQENEFTRTSFGSVDSGVQSVTSSQINLSEGQESTEQNSAEKKALKEKEDEENRENKQPVLPETPLKQERVDSSASRPKFLDFSVLRDASFNCYALFGLFASLGFFAPQLYVIELSVSRGVSRDSATYMLSAMAVAEILGRLSMGWVLNRRPIRKIYILLICTVLLCPVLVIFTFVTEFWGLMSCSCFYGFLLGTVASSHIPMLAEDDVIGIQRMSSAVGVYVCIQSFAGLAGPPLGGFLVDRTDNYGSAFYSCAAGMGVGALFLGLVRPAKSGLCLWRRRNDQQTTDRDSSSQGSDYGPADFVEMDMELDNGPAKSKPWPV